MYVYVKVVVVAALNYIGEGLRRGLLREYADTHLQMNLRFKL